MTRIALFGGKGYLGSQLAAYLSAQGTACDVFDIPAFDVTRAECWESFHAADYSAILFFAGMTGTEKSFTDAERFFLSAWHRWDRKLRKSYFPRHVSCTKAQITL